MASKRHTNIAPEIGLISKSSLDSLLKNYSTEQIFILVDENTQLFTKHLFESTPKLNDVTYIEIKSGEENKNIATATHIWSTLSNKQTRRDSILINLGGGVITDIGGFCASTYKRGIDFINIPTTLLAMVDASVGGKTGIDLDNFKNQVGLFAEPKGVFCDKTFLKTLPQPELISGFAEVLKHGLIKDKEYWKYCTETEFEKLDWDNVIFNSIRIKKTVVENDPNEKGERKLLNFGHTIGHAIETFMMNKSTPILHGEAVAVGMICESYISSKTTSLPQVDLEETTKEILRLFPKVKLEKASFNDLIQLMKNDKKNTSEDINFTLLKTIGEGVFNQHCSTELIKEALSYYIGL